MLSTTKTIILILVIDSLIININITITLNINNNVTLNSTYQHHSSSCLSFFLFVSFNNAIHLSDSIIISTDEYKNALFDERKTKR